MTTIGNRTRITLTAQTVEKIAELLERCDEFIRHADPAVRAELCTHLGPHASGYDLNLFIDDLGFTAAELRHQLATAAEIAVEHQHARSTGQPR
ncbi:hypothetical protein M6B22_06635 [Jatrophihabitans cynanchi]|uniref:Uncharacterized protein n=1 Tax=Jatrophihabitans cynanchi TaxID=2944128 RepID=A0ABY7K0Q8_9ACTN|nr:hypothetical protein [Jatrophihabitans sp. SB3-54]WAX58436.1 hypothetical protein M6B22_06635 [Jatrophihabitans sp. SB3-54]